MKHLLEHIDMEFFYDIQDGNYVWHSNQDDAYTIGPEISVLFDKSLGTLIKHGKPSLVYEYYSTLTKAFDKINASEDLVILAGKVPLEKINQAISCSGTCHTIFENEINKIRQATGQY